MDEVCNRSVLLQAPKVAVYFTPPTPRCLRKAEANGRSGWSRPRAWEAGPVNSATSGPQASSAAHPRGRRPPACAAVTGTKVRGGRKGSGQKGLRGHVRGFPRRSSGKLRRPRGEPVSRRGSFGRSDVQRRDEPVFSARQLPASAGGSSGEHAPAILSASHITFWISRCKLSLRRGREQRPQRQIRC